MRQHNVLNLALLMLSVIDFALAAPVAVRERPEERLDADDVGTVSQKRWGSDDEGELPLAGSYHAPPPNPDLTDIMSQIAHTRWSLPGSDHVLPPALSPGHSSLPPSLGLENSGSQMPPTLNSPGSLPESDHMWPPVPNLDHAPPPNPDLTDIMSQIAHSRWSLPGSEHVLPPALSPGQSSLPPPSLGLENLGSQIYTDPPTLNSPGSLPESDHMRSPVPNLNHMLSPVPDLNNMWPPVPDLNYAPAPSPDTTDIMSQIANNRGSLPPGSTEELAKQPDIPPSSPKSMPVAGSPSPESPLPPPSPHTSQLGPSLGPSEVRFPQGFEGFLDGLVKNQIIHNVDYLPPSSSMPVAGPSLGPSEVHFPPGFEKFLDELTKNQFIHNV